MNNFRVGQKVVCIAKGGWFENDRDEPNDPRHPQYGGVFTITAVNRYPKPFGAYLSLLEIGGANEFASTGFRPAVERKTDISIFTRMLTDNKVTA